MYVKYLPISTKYLTYIWSPTPIMQKIGMDDVQISKQGHVEWKGIE